MNIQFPVSWLRDYLKADIAAKTLAHKLSQSGPSVEKIEKKDRDYVLDIEVTTNRPDAFSVFGVAREAHAILSYEKIPSSLIEPKGFDTKLQLDTSKPLPLEVLIRDKKLCPRFTAIIVDNVKIGASPALIRSRLELSGIRAISNIVDITNYLMLETGQPMHAFDYDKIEGSKMVLRLSRPHEKLKTLDGQIRQLPEHSIVIEDTKKIIDLCGIMGGANSQITSRTKRVVLFVQSYDPISIRKTSQELAFRTDASSRFEKGVDLQNIPNVLKRAVYLAKKTAGAKIASELIDIHEAKKEKQKEINLATDMLTAYLGAEVKIENAQKILGLLGFKVRTFGRTLVATPPSWRKKDVVENVDLIEEIARIYGYHNLPSTLPTGQIPKTEKNELEKAISLKNVLKTLGLTEVVTYSIISKKLVRQTDVKPEELVELSNPLTEEWQFMRPQIIPSLLEVIARNRFEKEKIKIFEVARTYIKQKGALPIQDLFLCFTLTDSSFLEGKGLIENIFDELNSKVEFEKLKEDHKLLAKGQSAKLTSGNQYFGYIGMINPYAQDIFRIEKGIVAAEINLSKLYCLPHFSKIYKPISKYPPVLEDISAIFGEGTDLNEIVSIVQKTGELLNKVEIIDVYKGANLSTGKKSVTIRITYQKTTGTPTAKEVAEAREKIIAELISAFHAQIRR